MQQESDSPRNSSATELDGSVCGYPRDIVSDFQNLTGSGRRFPLEPSGAETEDQEWITCLALKPFDPVDEVSFEDWVDDAAAQVRQCGICPRVFKRAWIARADLCDASEIQDAPCETYEGMVDAVAKKLFYRSCYVSELELEFINGKPHTSVAGALTWLTAKSMRLRRLAERWEYQSVCTNDLLRAIFNRCIPPDVLRFLGLHGEGLNFEEYVALAERYDSVAIPRRRCHETGQVGKTCKTPEAKDSRGPPKPVARQKPGGATFKTHGDGTRADRATILKEVAEMLIDVLDEVFEQRAARRREKRKAENSGRQSRTGCPLPRPELPAHGGSEEDEEETQPPVGSRPETGVIKTEIKVQGKTYPVLLCLEGDYNVCGASCADKWGLKPTGKRRRFTRGIWGQEMEPIAVTVGSVELNITFHEVAKLDDRVLIGAETLRRKGRAISLDKLVACRLVSQVAMTGVSDEPRVANVIRSQ